MIRERPAWAADSPLCFRIADCVDAMVRGRLDFNRRMKANMSCLRPLRASNFPRELQTSFQLLLAADDLAKIQYPGAPDVFSYSRMTPKQRDQWCESLLFIYRSLVLDRQIIGRPL